MFEQAALNARLASESMDVSLPVRPEAKGSIHPINQTIAEIAALTGWNQSLIKVRAFRARRKLQKLFLELRKKERS